MDNVVQFKPMRQIALSSQMWQCNCGCTLFKLYADGVVECGECGRLSTEMVVRWVPPEER